jgi:hypothetical protein
MALFAAVAVRITEKTARGVAEALLRGNADTIGDPDPKRPRGCLAVKAALACREEADPLRTNPLNIHVVRAAKILAINNPEGKTILRDLRLQVAGYKGAAVPMAPLRRGCGYAPATGPGCGPRVPRHTRPRRV